MVGVFEELKIFDLMDILRICFYLILLICGSKDKLNFSFMRSFYKLILEF